MANHKTTQSYAVKPGPFYGYIVVTAAFIIMVLIMGMYYSFGVFFKPMLADFGWTRAAISGAVSLSWILNGLTSIVLGGYNDRFGPRLLVVVCGLISALGYFLMSQISAIWQLYLFYGVIVSIGSSVFVPLVSTIAKWFIHRRTAMTGVVIAGLGIGSMIWPPVSDQLIQAYGWRTTFIMIGAVILVASTLASQFLRSDPSQVGQQAYRKKLEKAGDVHIETRSFALREAIFTWQFWTIFTMNACFGYCILTIQIHLVPYATDMGISATTAAVILAIIGGASIIGRIGMGIVGDRIGNKNAYIMGFFLMLLCLFLLVFSKDLWVLYLFAIVFGIAYGDCAVQMSPLVAATFGLNALGLIFGFIGLGFTVGAAIGPFVSGYIFDVTESYQLAFLVAIVFCIIGLILNISFKPIKSRD